MNAKIKTTSIAKESSNAAVDSVSRATITAMGVVSGLVGLWALACIAGAISTNGLGGLVTGFVSAVTGM